MSYLAVLLVTVIVLAVKTDLSKCLNVRDQRNDLPELSVCAVVTRRQMRSSVVLSFWRTLVKFKLPMLVLRLQRILAPCLKDTCCRVLPSAHHTRFTRGFTLFFFFFTQSLFRMSGLPQLTASMATVHLVNKLCCAEDRTAQTCFYFDMPYFTSPKICALLFCFVLFFKAATKCVRARFKDLIFRSRS